MGIPSYFAHLVRSHRRVIKEVSHKRTLRRLYLDCNSIIYDSVRMLKYDPKHLAQFERQLIACVIEKIKDYIRALRPTDLVYVAFDGVAPVAKLEQQRGRRFKGSWHKQAVSRFQRSSGPSWDTTAITPGTRFMGALTRGARSAFSSTVCRELRVGHVKVSGPDEPGEGEHKIYHHIRVNKAPVNGFSAVYGLDADLIMLTLNHLSHDPTLVLYRETPEFIRSLDRTLDPNKRYVLDIPAFANILASTTSTTAHDYIFSCFLLGNDFLPHFPALNIRLDGLERVGEARCSIRGLVDGPRINWPTVRRFIAHLARDEEGAIEDSIHRRRKQSRNVRRNLKTDDDWVNALPMFDRELEEHVWRLEDSYADNRQRYYKDLVGVDPSETRIAHMSQTYIEGLAWTWAYYTGDCPSWRWHYPYPYPPLLRDLVRYIPTSAGSDPTPRCQLPPVHPWVQLAYVLPRSGLSLLPRSLTPKLNMAWYPQNVELKYAFCRYLWESHPIMPDIPLHQLENIVKEVRRSLNCRKGVDKSRKTKYVTVD